MVPGPPPPSRPKEDEDPRRPNDPPPNPVDDTFTDPERYMVPHLSEPWQARTKVDTSGPIPVVMVPRSIARSPWDRHEPSPKTLRRWARKAEADRRARGELTIDDAGALAAAVDGGP